MSDILKCPYCGGILEQSSIFNLNSYACTDLTCKGYYMTATKDMWQELIKLMEYKDLSDKIGKLETELERTRKALEIAKDAIDKGEAALIGCQEADDKYISDVTAEDGLELMGEAYKKITALEQKEAK